MQKVVIPKECNATSERHSEGVKQKTVIPKEWNKKTVIPSEWNERGNLLLISFAMTQWNEIATAFSLAMTQWNEIATACSLAMTD